MPVSKLLENFHEGSTFLTQNNTVHEYKGPIFKLENETIWGFTARILLYTFNELEKQMN